MELEYKNITCNERAATTCAMMSSPGISSPCRGQEPGSGDYIECHDVECQTSQEACLNRSGTLSPTGQMYPENMI